MNSLRPAESTESHGCPVVLRYLEGPEAQEVFLHCRPPPGNTNASMQAAAIYQAIHETLKARGASLAAVVSETVFLRNLPANIDPVRAARKEVFAGADVSARAAAVTEI